MNRLIERLKNLRKPHSPYSFRSIAVLIVFLLISCSLIFGIATVGAQRRVDSWLPSISYRGSADYGVDEFVGPPRPRIREEVIEDAEKDALVATAAAAPTPVTQTSLTPTATPTTSPTPTSTPEASNLLVQAGGPYEGEEGSRIRVEANIPGLIDIVPGSITYRWDFDNDGQFDDDQGRVASALFFDEGNYPISVQASDLFGQVATDTTFANVINVIPTVRVGPDTIFAEEAETVFFEAFAEDPGNDILFYEWDFGDGTVQVLDTLSPEHIYADNGDYLVTLRVSDNDNGVNEDTLRVQVSNQVPVVEAGPDQTVDEGGEPLVFVGTAQDPAGEADPLTYAWDFDYDGENFTTQASGAEVSRAYFNGPRSHVVALRVDDGDGGQAIDTLNVNVNNVPPVINRVSNDGPAPEGSEVAVTIEASDVASDTLLYSFDWLANGSYEVVNQTSATASRQWNDNGLYQVRVRVDDGDGGQVFATNVISIANVAPTVILNGDTSGFEGDTLSLSASVTDPGADTFSYNWQLGGGSAPNTTGIVIARSFVVIGVYTVTLTVTVVDGGVGSASRNITIFNRNPVANAGGNRTVNEEGTLDFNGTATDPGTADTLTYDWDFDYDGSNFDIDASGANVTSAPEDFPNGPDTIDVALRVRDDDYANPPSGGNEIGENINVIQVTVENVPPTNAQAVANPATVMEGEPVTLTGSADDVALDTLTYRWDIDNDGDFDDLGTLIGETVVHSWTTAGVYQVVMRVRDGDGGQASATTNDIFVTNGPPVADAGGPYFGEEDDPLNPTSPESPVIFDASGTTDPSIPADTLTYIWDFGDGNVVTTTNVTVAHIYEDDPPGAVDEYPVLLTVNDGNGGVATDTTTVTIDNRPPNITSFTGASPVPEGGTVIFNGGANDPAGANDTLSYQWIFDDGNDITGLPPQPHTYMDDNNGLPYNAQLIVSDEDGESTTDTIPITVTNVAPTVAITSNIITATEGVSVTFTGIFTDPGDDLLTYSWDFQDGSQPLTGTVSLVSLLTTTDTVTHAFTDNGVYTVTVDVDDGDGGNDTDIFTVTVENAPPTVTINSTYTTTVGVPIPLLANGQDVPSDTLTYSWDTNEDNVFGDELGQTITFTNVAAPGIFTITVRTEDEDGGVSVPATTQVEVNSLLPLALLGGIPYYLMRRCRRKKRNPCQTNIKKGATNDLSL